MTASLARAAAAAVIALLSLTGCTGVRIDQAATRTPPAVSSPIPRLVPGSLHVSGEASPQDPKALGMAREWLISAVLPPGMHRLSVPPSPAPRAPTSAACDWLVQAAKWWWTTSLNADSARSWLIAHPVPGLAATGTLTGPGGTSTVVERSAQQNEGLVSFEFVPDGRRTVVRVDVEVVPQGAQCASSAS